MKVPWDIGRVELVATKHFALGSMRKWGWNTFMLREAVRECYKIEKVGQNKFEIYVQKSGYKKIITVYYDAENILVCITGAEGGNRI